MRDRLSRLLDRIGERDGDNTYRTIYLIPRGRGWAVHLWDDGAIHLDFGLNRYWRLREPR